MPLPKPGELPHYTSTLDCFKKTIKNEGVSGLYKGMGAPLVGVSPIFAISFMGYGVGKQIFCPTELSQHTHLQYFTAGAFSGIFTTSIMAPGERIKCLLQIQEGNGTLKVYDGPVDVVKKLYKQGGIAAVYRGAGATLLRGNGVFYCIQILKQEHNDSNDFDLSSSGLCNHNYLLNKIETFLKLKVK